MTWSDSSLNSTTMDMQVHVKTYTVLVVNTNGCLQISLNQLALGPVVTAVVFTWNLVLQNRASEVPDKLRQDFVPTLVNGKPESPLANTCVPSSTQVRACQCTVVLQAGSFGYQQRQSTFGLCQYSPKCCTCLFVACYGQHTSLILPIADISW